MQLSWWLRSDLNPCSDACRTPVYMSPELINSRNGAKGYDGKQVGLKSEIRLSFETHNCCTSITVICAPFWSKMGRESVPCSI